MKATGVVLPGVLNSKNEKNIENPDTYELSFPSFPKIKSCVTISRSYNYDIRN